jgi:hypothetical protein
MRPIPSDAEVPLLALGDCIAGEVIVLAQSRPGIPTPGKPSCQSSFLLDGR